jgi:hypothetical protein
VASFSIFSSVFHLKQPRRHACIVEIAEDILQRLQLFDEVPCDALLKQWRKKLGLVAQFLERLAQLVAMFVIELVKPATSLADLLHALRRIRQACRVMGLSRA